MEQYKLDEENWESDVSGHGLRHTVCGDYFEFPWQAKRHKCEEIWEDYV